MDSKDKNGEMCVACWELMTPLFQRAGFSSLLQASLGHCSGRPARDSIESQSHQVALILAPHVLGAAAANVCKVA